MPVLPSYRNRQLIGIENQFTVFYMRATLALNGLIKPDKSNQRKVFLHLLPMFSKYCLEKCKRKIWFIYDQAIFFNHQEVEKWLQNQTLPYLLFINSFSRYLILLLYWTYVLSYFCKSLTKYSKSTFQGGVTFHSLLVTRWNSLVARCLL